MIFAWLGSIQLGGTSALTGPTAAEETLAGDHHEHKVVRGKPVPQLGGAALDRQSFSFFFDESFCAPEDEYARLVFAQTDGAVLPFTPASGGFRGKYYFIRQLKGVTHKTTEGGRVTRISATLELVEVPGSTLTSTVLGIATVAASALNPLVKRGS